MTVTPGLHAGSNAAFGWYSSKARLAPRIAALAAGVAVVAQVAIDTGAALTTARRRRS